MSDSVSRLRPWRGRFPWNAFRRWASTQIVFAALLAVLAALGPRFFPSLSEVSGPFAVLLFLLWTLASGAQLILPLGEILAWDPSGDPSGVLSDEPRWSDTEWDELHARLAGAQARILAVKVEARLERQRLETWVGSITDAVLAVDSQGLPVFFNSRFAAWFGQGRLPVSAPSSETARIPGLGELFRSLEVLSAFRAVLGFSLPDSRVRQATGPLRRVVTLPVADESAPRIFELGIEPLLDPEGRVEGAVAVFHDITELKRAEQMRIDFVANASHELRTPLTSIKGYVDTLLHDLGANQFDSVSKFAGVIARNTDRLMSLIDDLLDLSQLEAGVRGLELQLVRPREMTERVLLQVTPLCEARRQRIHVESTVERLLADPGRIEQVLLNLVTNAIKYSPEGSSIRVNWNRDSTGDGVLLAVADDGPGIPLEHQSRIFERFYRVDKARSREQGGTGLGLSIVKHIVQAHGGQVTLRSEPGKGSEFTCRFPQDGLA